MANFFQEKHIPFMKYGKLTTTISLVTFILAIIFLILRGLNFSVEFTGGTVMEFKYQQPQNINLIRDKLDNTLKMQGISVQNLGTTKDILIRLPNIHGKDSAVTAQEVRKILNIDGVKATNTKTEYIGPQIGQELVTKGLVALFFVIIGIIIYLAIRFEWRFAVSAIIANMHDVIIILGCFAFFGWEFSLTTLAGVLAVLGYSVNESVIVFDRIRENMRKPEMRDRSIPDIIDHAINATMSRTIITHGSTEAIVVSMLIFGGTALHSFAMALTIGIVFGIYSSVLVASPLLLLFKLDRASLIKVVKKKEEAVV